MKRIKIFMAAFVLLGLSACGNKAEADPVTVSITGRVSMDFSLSDARTECPECTQVYAKVLTEEWGDVDYGPFPFSIAGVTLKRVVAGSDHDITIWILDSTGVTIYQGVATGVEVAIGGTTIITVILDPVP